MDADETETPRGAAHESRRWANYFEVGYNAYEVVLHFGQLYAHNGEVQWHTRIVTHPAYAGEFLTTLRASLDEYERAFPAGKGGQMPNEVQYKLTLAVKDGPKLDLSDTVKVDAYDKVEFELRSGASQPVDLQPTDPAPQIHFLVIQVKPDPKADPTDTKTVWYTVDGGAPIALANSHALVGKGVINLLAKTPKTLTFTNKRDTTVTITCLVGRDNKQQQPGTGPGGGGTGYPGGGGGGGTTPEYPGGGGGGTTPEYPGGSGGGTTPYPGGGGGGTPPPPYPGGGGGGTPPYPAGGGGGGTTYPGGGGGTPPPPSGGGGGTTYPGGGGTPPTYPGGPGGGSETPPPGNPGGQRPTYPSGSENPPPPPPTGGEWTRRRT